MKSALLFILPAITLAQVPPFEVATIKPVDSDPKAGRYLTMQGTNRFIGKNYTLKLMIAAAYNLNPRMISGGPAWVEADHYDILALTPGSARPSREEQMAMLRVLLAERFGLKFHREQREFAIYALGLAKGGAKLKDSGASAKAPSALVSTVYPQRLVLPARNASMADFTSMLQRAVLDRPVVDETGLPGRYDFDLEWAPDESQFNGEIPAAPADAPSPPLFTALQQQLGLRLEAKRGMVSALLIDGVGRPSEN